MKTVGILGGMGPVATLDLARHIIEATPAKSDQGHIPLLIHNNTQIPDRTLAIVNDGECPLSELRKSVDILSKNSDFIIMPCNTAHYYYDKIASYSSVPVIHMVEETAKMIKQSYPDVCEVGLLATDGTVHSKIYEKIFANYNISILIPDRFDQKHLVMDSIYGADGIKAGFKKMPTKKLQLAGEKLVHLGAQLIIGGCTEIPLVLKQKKVSYVVIDPAKVLAEVTVGLATEKVVEFETIAAQFPEAQIEQQVQNEN